MAERNWGNIDYPIRYYMGQSVSNKEKHLVGHAFFEGIIHIYENTFQSKITIIYFIYNYYIYITSNI